MKIAKVLPAIVIAACVGLVASCQALGLHDRNTRARVLALVHKELPVGASLSDMERFMQRHTTRYALDDRFRHSYGGMLAQSSLDKDLFDRPVGVELHFDRNHRFTTADVNVYYTFL
jgi:hypothetical protein